MNLNNILNQVLGAGEKLAQGGHNKDTLLKVGGGMAAGSLLSMLLGGKGTGKMMKAGSLAAVGALAYRAYQNWQSTQPKENAANSQHLLDAPPHERGGQAGEDASRIILRTMIAAAAADGNIDAGEQQILLGEIGQNDPEVQQWLAAQIQQPATPEELARDIGTDTALASEAYLAARIICGDLERKEIAFLSRFSDALHLDDTLVERLERQAGF
ncbi:MAG: tellurite resistance TerB family protein [Cardiobacteriaceae bacterium]|nr:tellurite resistance TerB family protein [Cardiobacteriaceae bacterium]